jgi:hypothetical protein
MKIKIKDILFENIILSPIRDFSLSTENQNTLFSVKYSVHNNTEEISFQTPHMVIDRITDEPSGKFMYLNILQTNACKLFYTKIKMFEATFTEKLKRETVSVMKPDDTVKIKISHHYNHPMVETFHKSQQIPYNSLKPLDKIICLLVLNKIWVSNDKIFYNLSVSEILKI